MNSNRRSFECRVAVREPQRVETALGCCLTMLLVVGCSGSDAGTTPGINGQGGANVGGATAVTGGTTTLQNTSVVTGGVLAIGGAKATGGAQAPTGGKSLVSTGGSPAQTGGAATGGRSSMPQTGGATLAPTGGVTAIATGGTRTTPAGGTSSTPTGGRSSVGGTTGMAGGTAVATGGRGGGGTGVPGNYPIGNPPVPSTGCGNAQGMTTLLIGATTVASGLSTSHRLTMTSASGGGTREYIIDIPANYDANKPYRLFFTFHWIGSTDTAVATGSVSNGGATNWGFYGLHRMATTANEPAIFVAPQGIGGSWGQQDHAFFDDMLKLFTSDLCIDISRVFITGFSFGGMITYSLSTAKQKSVRAAVGIAPANYNIWLPNPIPRDPIAWMCTTGMSDNTCPYDGGASSRHGAKYIAVDRALDNGCTTPTAIPTTTVGSKTHLCYDFQGCKSNYPLKVCTFDGGHQAAPADGGTADNGLTSWIPTASWQFFTQF